MKFTETKLKSSYLIEIEPFSDERGFFARNFCTKDFKKAGLDFSLAQSSISFNITKGTLRGIHFQKKPYEEVKLVSCIKGSVFDVIVDLRENSPTYCKWDCAILSADNYKTMYVPKGFGHGFQTLEDETIIHYQMSESFKPEYYDGVLWNDPAFNIKWPDVKNRIISKKDQSYKRIYR